jgi:hypothetical protein
MSPAVGTIVEEEAAGAGFAGLVAQAAPKGRAASVTIHIKILGAADRTAHWAADLAGDLAADLARWAAWATERHAARDPSGIVT